MANEFVKSKVKMRALITWPPFEAITGRLADLPETRSVEVLETEKTRMQERKASLDLEIRQEREKIGKGTRDHLDLDSLTDKILA